MFGLPGPGNAYDTHTIDTGYAAIGTGPHADIDGSPVTGVDPCDHRAYVKTMIRLSKKSEYALFAIGYLRGHSGDSVASVKEIAGHYGIPKALLAKVMQLLKRSKIVRSAKGMTGGYALERPLNSVYFLEFLHLMDEQTTLVDCLSADAPMCSQEPCCEIRNPITALNALLHKQFQTLTLEQLFDLEAPSTGHRVSLNDIGVRTVSSQE